MKQQTNDLEADVQTLAQPSGRVPGTQGHLAAREFLRTRFAELGLLPYPDLAGFEHRFTTGEGLSLHNLIGVLPGRDRSAAPLLLGAHYDSAIPGPSADDNAAAVAVMLAVAQRLAGMGLDRDVIIAAFDAEEPPYFLTSDMGSARFVAEVLQGPVHLAVIMDLVGHPMVVEPLTLDPHLIFVVGAETNPNLPAALSGLELPIVPTRYERVGSFSDYDAFRKAGAPYLFFSVGEWPAYHSWHDTIDGLDFEKLRRLTGDLVTLLVNCDQADLGSQSDHDTTEWEIAALREHLGPANLAAAAALMGQRDVSTRADLDALVPALRGVARSGGDAG